VTESPALLALLYFGVGLSRVFAEGFGSARKDD
jgi:hypothetical protein